MNLIPSYLLGQTEIIDNDSITVESKTHASEACRRFVENLYIPSLKSLDTHWSMVVAVPSKYKSTPFVFNQLLVKFFNKHTTPPDISAVSLSELLLEAKKEEFTTVLEQKYEDMLNKNNEIGIITTIDTFNAYQNTTIHYLELLLQKVLYDRYASKIAFIYFYEEPLKDVINFCYRNYYLLE